MKSDKCTYTPSQPVLFDIDRLNLSRTHNGDTDVPQLAQMQFPAVAPLPQTAMFLQSDRDRKTNVTAILPAVEQERRQAAQRGGELQPFVRHRVGSSSQDSDLADVIVGGVGIRGSDVCGVGEGVGPEGEEAGVVVCVVVVAGGRPGEDGLVVGLFDNFELESEEGFSPFAVQQWHVDVE